MTREPLTASELKWLKFGVGLAIVMAYAALIVATVTAGLAWSAVADLRAAADNTLVKANCMDVSQLCPPNGVTVTKATGSPIPCGIWVDGS